VRDRLRVTQKGSLSWDNDEDLVLDVSGWSTEMVDVLMHAPTQSKLFLAKHFDRGLHLFEKPRTPCTECGLYESTLVIKITLEV